MMAKPEISRGDPREIVIGLAMRPRFPYPEFPQKTLHPAVAFWHWRMNIVHDQELSELRLKLARLEIEHEDYDAAIEAMTLQGMDALRIQRFKKKKLSLKDEITRLRARVIPDIIA